MTAIKNGKLKASRQELIEMYQKDLAVQHSVKNNDSLNMQIVLSHYGYSAQEQDGIDALNELKSVY